MSYIVHENCYKSFSKEERKEMWQEKSGVMSYEEWMRRFCERKYNSDFSKEMSRSVDIYLKSFLEK